MVAVSNDFKKIGYLESLNDTLKLSLLKFVFSESQRRGQFSEGRPVQWRSNVGANSSRTAHGHLCESCNSDDKNSWGWVRGRSGIVGSVTGWLQLFAPDWRS